MSRMKLRLRSVHVHQRLDQWLLDSPSRESFTKIDIAHKLSLHGLDRHDT